MDGWRINTKKFMIYVTEQKVVKAEKKLDQLLLKVGKKVKLRELSSVVGLIISFGLAVGRSARFYTRFSTTEVARVSEEKGWEAWLVLSVEVLEELPYWRANLRRLNGQKIRKRAGVQVVRPKLLYSDAGGRGLHGGQQEGLRGHGLPGESDGGGGGEELHLQGAERHRGGHEGLGGQDQGQGREVAL